MDWGLFNADGKQDLLLSNSNNILVFMGDGNGGFTPGASYAISTQGQEDIVVLDANKGHRDLLLIDGGGQIPLLGNGDGSFTQGGAFAASFSCQTPVVADFDRDGRIDIATVGIASGGVLSVLKNSTP